MGYHKRKIEKGIFGQTSKISEELTELNDAIEQDDKILISVELADLFGALEGVAIKYNLTMDDLAKFSAKTKSAFISGERT